MISLEENRDFRHDETAELKRPPRSEPSSGAE
jgi:hypothetical protein